MLKTLREFISELHPQSWVYLGADKMKAYEVLGRHTYLDGHTAMSLDLDTYNYRAVFNNTNCMWRITVYE